MIIKLKEKYKEIDIDTRLRVNEILDGYYLVSYRGEEYEIDQSNSIEVIPPNYDKDKHKVAKKRKKELNRKKNTKIKVKGKKNSQAIIKIGGKLSPMDSKKIKEIYNPR